MGGCAKTVVVAAVVFVIVSLPLPTDLARMNCVAERYISNNYKRDSSWPTKTTQTNSEHFGFEAASDRSRHVLLGRSLISFEITGWWRCVCVGGGEFIQSHRLID